MGGEGEGRRGEEEEEEQEQEEKGNEGIERKGCKSRRDKKR